MRVLPSPRYGKSIYVENVNIFILKSTKMFKKKELGLINIENNEYYMWINKHREKMNRKTTNKKHNHTHTPLTTTPQGFKHLMIYSI